MIRKFFAIAAASLAISAPAMAELTELHNGTFIAHAADGSAHNIEVLSMDHEGDFNIEVMTASNATGQWEFTTNTYWIKCASNQISYGNTWSQVNHLNMEGHYYDAACRPWKAN